MEIENCTDYGRFMNDKILLTEDLIPIRTLYVSQIFRSTTEDDLREYFTKYGPVEDIRLLKTKRNFTYAFVTFEDTENASSALKAEEDHIVLKKKIKVCGADSWHQPVEKTIINTNDDDILNNDINSENEISNDRISLLKLNDDCLLHILSYLNLFDLKHIESVCYRLKNLTEIIYKNYKILNFMDIKGDSLITLMDARNILSQVGIYLISVNVPAIKFATSNKRIIELLPKYCKNLQHIKLDGFTLTLPTLKKFNFLVKQLKSLILKSCGITEQIDKFLQIAVNLEELNLSQNFEINGKCLTKINNLKSLNLDNCVNLQPKYFSEFSKNNKTLIYLNISHCERINETNVINMIENFINLEHLVISNSYANLDQIYLGEFAKLKKLKKLQVNFISFNNINLLLDELAKKDLLEYLDISSCTNSNGILKALYRFTKLKILKLNYRIDLNDEVLIKMSEKNDLSELYIAGCFHMTDDGILRIIEQSKNLTVLDISGCDKITDELIYNTVEIIKSDLRTVKLEIVVGETQIERDIVEDEKIKNAASLLKMSFYSNFESHFYDSDMFDDLMENCEFDNFDDFYYDYDDDDDDDDDWY